MVCSGIVLVRVHLRGGTGMWESDAQVEHKKISLERVSARWTVCCRVQSVRPKRCSFPFVAFPACRASSAPAVTSTFTSTTITITTSISTASCPSKSPQRRVLLSIPSTTTAPRHFPRDAAVRGIPKFCASVAPPPPHAAKSFLNHA